MYLLTCLHSVLFIWHRVVVPGLRHPVVLDTDEVEDDDVQEHQQRKGRQHVEYHVIKYSDRTILNFEI